MADELKLTMSSVLKQKYSNIEHIIIDGGSSDTSIEMIESYVEPLSRLEGKLKWLSETDSGIYDAMNKGLSLATGDWVIFMNAGDSFASESVLNDVFSVTRVTDVIFGKSITHYKGLTSLRYFDFETKNKKWFYKKMPNHQAIFIHKSLYSQHRYDLSYKYSADTVFLRKIFSLAGSVEEVDFIISNFELGGKSNFYGNYTTFKAVVEDSIRVNKQVIRPLLKHTVKYFFQKLLGKDAYLKIYISLLNKK